jgi:hypothetical protein
MLHKDSCPLPDIFAAQKRPCRPISVQHPGEWMTGYAQKTHCRAKSVQQICQLVAKRLEQKKKTKSGLNAHHRPFSAIATVFDK